MQLSKYIDNGHATQSDLARALNVSRERLRHWVRGISRPKPRHALALERATGGKVTAEEAIGLGRRRRLIIRK